MHVMQNLKGVRVDVKSKPFFFFSWAQMISVEATECRKDEE